MPVHIEVHDTSGDEPTKIGEWITENDGTHRCVGETLTVTHMSQVNAERAREWHGSFPDADETGWTGADWSNAMAGECGEACNVVKKLRRHETSVVGKVDPPPAKLIEKLADEIADTVLYADLLATKYGIDLAAAIVRKFNAISDREGLPQRLEL